MATAEERSKEKSLASGRIINLGYLPVGLFFVFLGAAPLLIKDEYLRHLFVVGLLFGAQAMVSDFTVGFINLSNFGFAAFFGLGAYTTGLLVTNFGVSPFIGIIAGMLMAGLLGLFTGALTMRLRGLYVAIMAWFMALALQSLTLVLVDVTRGAWGLFVPPLFESTDILPYYYTLFVITLVIYIVIKLVINSRVGLAFKAIGMDVDFARASGVNPTRYKMIAFILSCAFAGWLGGFYAHFIGILTPDLMGTQHTVEVLALNVIGGRGSLWGPLLAAFLVIPPFEYLKSLMEVRLIIYGLLLVLVMVIYPAGMAGVIWKVGELLKLHKGATYFGMEDR
ncbi:MAG: branched-chain amino acid ABC transporter permease [Anaerolineales bacterium]|nr:branched-chain amino acid ABC transporter permease [Anaerolineales bacterium]